MSNIIPEAAWKATLSELELQMTKATFNTWLKDATLHTAENDAYTIHVRNPYAQDWLSTRLQETITRTLSTITGRPSTVNFIVRPDEAQPALPLPETEPGTAEPLFPGFEPFQSNFIQYPKQFNEIVVPAGPSVLTAFVSAVIGNTIGVITNYRTTARREWWEASYTDIGHAAGIESPASIGKAIKLARQRGYIIRRTGQTKPYKYRLRSEGEPVDNPVDNSPDHFIF